MGAVGGRDPARPVVFAGVAALVMIIIALPFLWMRLGSADSGTTRPTRPRARRTTCSPRASAPATTDRWSWWPGSDTKAQFAAFEAERAVARTPGVVGSPSRRVIRATPAPTVAIGNVYPKGSPQAASTSDLLPPCPHSRIPAATRGTGPPVLVGGTTAIFEDFSHVLSRKLPLFIGIVALLSFLLLMAVFRSLVIPLTAAVMNLLSVAAAFGIITAVFQLGCGRAARDRRHRPDRDVRVGADVPDPVRPLDGLRGVPDQPRLRGVAPRGATTARR